MIIRQGDELEEMYFIARGGVKMIREMRNNFREVAAGQAMLPGSDGWSLDPTLTARRGKAARVITFTPMTSANGYIKYLGLLLEWIQRGCSCVLALQQGAKVHPQTSHRDSS